MKKMETYRNEDGELCMRPLPLPDTEYHRALRCVKVSLVHNDRGWVAFHPDLTRLRCGSVNDFARG